MRNNKPLNDIKDLQMTFAYNIIPLLREYYFDNDKALKELLNGKFLIWDESGKIEKIDDKWKDDSEKFITAVKSAFPTSVV